MARRARERIRSPAWESLSSTTAVMESTRIARRANIRGRRGGLQSMPDMPWDILLETIYLSHPRSYMQCLMAQLFTYFHPADLFNLARTTKAFRAVLMSRSSKLY